MIVLADAVQQAPYTADTEQHPEKSDLFALARGWHGRIELTRQNTAHGTPGESTQTKLRIDTVLRGAVTLFRVDLPFPDDKTSFSGDPFNPRPGDLKTRIGFAPFEAGALSFPWFIEATFPTANPESLGTGKYQLSAAIRMLAPLKASPDHEARLEGQAQQANAVAGDRAAKDINYTKFELTLNDTWRGTYTFKLKLKPAVDWTQNGRTGSVGEVEGGLFFRRDWRAWLMLGHRMTGPSGIPSTYSDRIELGIARKF
ncbi:MAG TPA: hypothetical protein VKP89_00650 [Burkholderiales bacterium]|nr:hypothetical protein [Burkholderiales bacterium]